MFRADSTSSPSFSARYHPRAHHTTNTQGHITDADVELLKRRPSSEGLATAVVANGDNYIVTGEDARKWDTFEKKITDAHTSFNARLTPGVTDAEKKRNKVIEEALEKVENAHEANQAKIVTEHEIKDFPES